MPTLLQVDSSPLGRSLHLAPPFQPNLSATGRRRTRMAKSSPAIFPPRPSSRLPASGSARLTPPRTPALPLSASFWPSPTPLSRNSRPLTSTSSAFPCTTSPFPRPQTLDRPDRPHRQDIFLCQRYPRGLLKGKKATFLVAPPAASTILPPSWPRLTSSSPICARSSASSE